MQPGFLVGKPCLQGAPSKRLQRVCDSPWPLHTVDICRESWGRELGASIPQQTGGTHSLRNTHNLASPDHTESAVSLLSSCGFLHLIIEHLLERENDVMKPKYCAALRQTAANKNAM